MLESALNYCKLGWRVFPVGRDKVPYISQWQLRASSDPAVIAEWWAKYPNANIGLATGAGSGLFALDVDTHKSGAEALRALVAQHGPLPATRIARTGRGGMHVLFRHPGIPVKNSVATLGNGLDVRGDGGYIVVAPSVHENGVAYKWLNDAPLAPAPDWLLSHACKPRAPGTDGPTSGPASEYPDADEELLTQARAFLEAHGPAIEGQRGDDHTYAAAALLVGDFALSFDQAWPLFVEWNAACDPPWPLQELGKKLLGGRKYSVGTYGRYREDRPVVYFEPDVDPETLLSSTADVFDEPAPLDLPLAHENSDEGNAQLFAQHNRATSRFVPEWGSWLSWTGTHWRRDDQLATEAKGRGLIAVVDKQITRARARLERVTAQLAKHPGATLSDTARVITRAQELEAEKLKAELERQTEQIKALRARHLTLSTLKYQRSMLTTATSLACLNVSAEHLNADPYLLTVANGTLDLRTGELRPHSPEDYITKALDTAYDRDATAPLWTAFLEKIMLGDSTMISYLQRAAGYTLTGEVSEHVFFFLHGDGQNGKSTFVSTLQRLLGPYAVQCKSDLLLKRFTSHDSDTSTLPGARMVIHGEPALGRSFDDGMVKQLVGGDRISARFMGKERFEFDPSHKIWMSSNPRPNIAGQDNGIWRRVQSVHFELNLPNSERDNDLPKKLADELPGILRWAVLGCLEWQADGLQPPEKVLLDNEEYRHSEDTFSAFLWECFEKSPGCYVTRKELYMTYTLWCTDNGVRQPASSKDFTLQMRRILGKTAETKRDGERRWRGIKRVGDENPKRASIDADEHTG